MQLNEEQTTQALDHLEEMIYYARFSQDVLANKYARDADASIKKAEVFLVTTRLPSPLPLPTTRFLTVMIRGACTSEKGELMLKNWIEQKEAERDATQD